MGVILKVLVFSGLFPTASNESAGAFITRRLTALQNTDVDFDAIVIDFFDSSFASIVRRLLRRGAGRQKKDLLAVERSKEFPFNLYKYISLEKRVIDYAFKRCRDMKAEAAIDAWVTGSIDIIHAHWVDPNGYLAVRTGKKHGIPVVVTAHGSDIHTNASKSRSSLKRTLFTLENASKVIFVSKALKRAAMDFGYSGKNSIVIPNGIDSKMIEQVSKDKSIRNPIGCERPSVVGFVGNLVPVKRADKLPMIFSKIREYENVQFVVLGDGDLRSSIENQCIDMGLEVNFVGRVAPDEVPDFMNLMDVMVLPSRNEGWPCVVLEAQACGVPVVGSDNGGIPEAIGEEGSVVPDGENFEERFAKAVVEILKNPVDPQELRKRAVQFDWSITVGKEIEVYKKVIAKKD